jgi:hypothetical protein
MPDDPYRHAVPRPALRRLQCSPHRPTRQAAPRRDGHTHHASRHHVQHHLPPHDPHRVHPTGACCYCLRIEHCLSANSGCRFHSCVPLPTVPKLASNIQRTSALGSGVDLAEQALISMRAHRSAYLITYLMRRLASHSIDHQSAYLAACRIRRSAARNATQARTHRKPHPPICVTYSAAHYFWASPDGHWLHHLGRWAEPPLAPGRAGYAIWGDAARREHSIDACSDTDMVDGLDPGVPGYVVLTSGRRIAPHFGGSVGAHLEHRQLPCR